MHLRRLLCAGLSRPLRPRDPVLPQGFARPRSGRDPEPARHCSAAVVGQAPLRPRERRRADPRAAPQAVSRPRRRRRPRRVERARPPRRARRRGRLPAAADVNGAAGRAAAALQLVHRPLRRRGRRDGGGGGRARGGFLGRAERRRHRGRERPPELVLGCTRGGRALRIRPRLRRLGRAGLRHLRPLRHVPRPRAARLARPLRAAALRAASRRRRELGRTRRRRRRAAARAAAAFHLQAALLLPAAERDGAEPGAGDALLPHRRARLHARLPRAAGRARLLRPAARFRPLLALRQGRLLPPPLRRLPAGRFCPLPPRRPPRLPPQPAPRHPRPDLRPRLGRPLHCPLAADNAALPRPCRPPLPAWLRGLALRHLHVDVQLWAHPRRRVGRRSPCAVWRGEGRLRWARAVAARPLRGAPPAPPPPQAAPGRRDGPAQDRLTRATAETRKS
mmetsp:Transcript_20175/g.68240  ORF Transcript_20175/g.68240 Transcript_20175/m.68240 type:complete len:449 (+) Transcript_20175:190-1536(+)